MDIHRETVPVEQKCGFSGEALSSMEKQALGIETYARPFSVETQDILFQRRKYWRWKRLIDVLFSSIAIVCLLPLFLIVSLCIVLDDPHGSPIFKQDRVGHKGKPFHFYKFRSMCTDAEAKLEALQAQNEFQGKAFKMKNDPRITRVGRVIRNTSIDELPQLFNVLKGNMTIVGPRPPLPREVAQYDEYEKQRLLITPGLTCFWQVYPKRHEITFDDWVALDLKYIVERSLLVDVKLIWMTVGVMLSGQAD